MAEEEKNKQLSKRVFGSTYHPIPQNLILGRMKKGETQKEQYDRHKKIKEDFFKKGVKPSEILKLDKEFDKRYDNAIKNEKLKKKLNRIGLKDGGSLKPVPAEKKGLKKLPTKIRNKMGFMNKGGRVGLKSGGLAKRGKGCEIK